MTAENQTLRDQLAWLLEEGHAHLSFDDAVADLPFERQGVVPGGMAHSPWQQLEHLRLCQWDILEFSRDPSHVSPEFPDGYWPADPAPPNERAWERSADAFREDRSAFCGLLLDDSRDLFAAFPWGDGQTLLREALVLADHNSYHLGQLVATRRALGCWK